jgi:hypothetical protein
MSPKIHSTFWSDEDVENLDSECKLVLLWLITNPNTNLLGICQPSSRRFQLDTALPVEALQRAYKALPKALSVVGGSVFIRNYIRYQFGVGTKLTKNNIFRSIQSAYESTKDESLRGLVLGEYPEFQAAEEGLTKGLQAQREREREGTRTGEGKREGEGQLVLPAIPPETDLDSFVEEVYALYPRKVEPIDAKKAIRKVIKEYGSPLIRERTAAYAKVVDELIPVKSERQFVPHPATWFNAGGFLTDEVEWRTTLQRGSPKPDHRAERAAKQFTETIVPKEIKIIPKQAA